MLCFSPQQIMIMDNHNVPINTFINNQNFTDANNLTDLLGNDYHCILYYKYVCVYLYIIYLRNYMVLCTIYIYIYIPTIH